MRNAETMDVDSSPLQNRLAALYDGHSADVYGFVLTRCGDPLVAGEVLSDVFLAAARATAGDRPDQVTRSWLLTTARRRLIDHWRRQSSRQRVVSALMSERVAPSHDPEVDPDQVAECLATLSLKQRAGLTLRYLDEFSVSEVADALELSYSATESLLARARRSFKRAWEER